MITMSHDNNVTESDDNNVTVSDDNNVTVSDDNIVTMSDDPVQCHLARGQLGIWAWLHVQSHQHKS